MGRPGGAGRSSQGTMGPRGASLNRVVTSGLLASAAAVLAAGAAVAQDEPRNQLHYPAADELAGLLRGADAAREAGRHDQAIELYRAVLDRDAAGKVGYQVAATGPRRYRGVTTWAIEGLRKLPPDGVRQFRARYDYRAASALAEALKAADPVRALARAYELHPIATQAPELLRRQAELALERGQLGRALRCYEDLLRHHPDELGDPTSVRRQMLLCAVGLGLPEQVRELARALRRDDPEGGVVHPSGAPVALDELLTRELAAESRRVGRAGAADLRAVRGDPSNRAWFDAKLAPGPARFAPRTFDADRVGGPRPFQPGQMAQAYTPARNLPVVHDGAVFVTTADQVRAFDVRTGDERPRIPRLGRAYSDPNLKVQFGAAVSQGMLVAPFVDEVILDQQFRGIPIKVQIPLRKLAGFDTESWRWTWSHERAFADTPMDRWSFPCPPVADEGVVFAPAFEIAGFVNCHVGAFDARTGDPLWTTWVVSGQVEQTMFGEQATEPLAAPVAVAGGVVYYSTSFGCAAALDATTGRPLWFAEYEQLEVRAPKGYFADPRTIAWENNAPLVIDGVAVMAPLDSPTYFGLDVATGDRLWEARQAAFAADGAMRYLMGAGLVEGRGVVVVAGGSEARCVDVRTGKLVWRASLRGRTVAGRGCVSGGLAAIPVDRDELFVFALDTGKRVGSFELAATGNVIVCGDTLLVTSNGTLGVHRNGEALQRGQDF